MRMGVEFPDPLPAYCPSCGEMFDVSHALKCKKGGWGVRRHNEVVRAWIALFKRVSTYVEPEPTLAPPIGLTRSTTTRRIDARADILARGLLVPMQDDYHDVAVIDTGAASYVDRKSASVLQDKETMKRGKYEERVEPLGGSFTPLVCSVFGTLAPEAHGLLTRVVKGLDTEQAEKRSTRGSASRSRQP
jgi:hypothetical protein